jgi:UDP-glucose 4-epimerase
MEQDYLIQLLELLRQQNGGVVLQQNGKSQAVVLNIERYYQLLAKAPNEELKTDPQTILVTGGAGYIGSYCAKRLLKHGYQVIVLDHHLTEQKHKTIPAGATVIEGDYGDQVLLREIFAANQINAVLHLASSIEVPESFAHPDLYFLNNVVKSAILFSVMSEFKVKRLLFSSTCGVYGEGRGFPLKETDPIKPMNPYAHSKALVEELLQYLANWEDFKITVLRSFNAAGCDEESKVTSRHDSALVPKIIKVLTGEEPQLVIAGDKYPTIDGTALRDFIHVSDIARAFHLALVSGQTEAYEVYNVGSGSGYTVKQMFDTAVEVTGKIAPMIIGPERPGDIPVSVADTTKIRSKLGFVAKYSNPETIFKNTWASIQ